jgi:divalent metal cation (Fe/Co/Zn/Cd) transporter
MLSEGIHSLADIANQTLLAIGIKVGRQMSIRYYSHHVLITILFTAIATRTNKRISVWVRK